MQSNFRMFHRVTRRAGLALLALTAAYAAPVPSTIALQSSANPSNLTQAVTLTATVSPASATGTVTFYDGVTVLGIRPVAAGQATLTTTQLPSGIRSLKAYYSGDSNDLPSTSAALIQTVAALPASGFHPAVTAAGVSFLFSVTATDFNNDGKPDLAAADFNTNTVGIMLGNGDGTFKPAVTYPVGAVKFPTWIAVADFNGDGKPDLAVVAGATGSSGIAVLIGVGDGTFKPAVDYPTAAGHSIVAADFNGDGVVDLAIAGPTNVSILLGKGDGTFKPAVNLTTSSGGGVLAAGDFNGDGKTDLAVTAAGGLSIMIGNGDGTFKASMPIELSGNPGFVAVADLTGKGRSDLAVTTPRDQLAVLLSNGDGTFKPAVNYTVPAGLNSVAVGDFNGDGVPDLVATGGTSGSASVLLGNGDGTFGQPLSYTAGAQAMYAAVADYNSDGRADVAVGDFTPGTVNVLLAAATTSDLTITKSHAGDFMQGQTGAAYTISVANVGGPSGGVVTVTDTLPPLMTATAMTGTGWNCTLAGATCTRVDGLPSGGTYPPITLTVNIDPAAPASMVNTATVAGGADANLGNNSSMDTANVIAALAIVTTSLDPGAPGAPYDVLLAANGGTPPYAWSIVSGSLPDGVTMSGAGEISGTPTAAGDSMFVVMVTDAVGATASQMLDLTIADSPASGMRIRKGR
jgi:hypothetical protein